VTEETYKTNNLHNIESKNIKFMWIWCFLDANMIFNFHFCQVAGALWTNLLWITSLFNVTGIRRNGIA
jgi:hypothetical protein